MTEENLPPDQADPGKSLNDYIYKQISSTLDEGSYFTLEQQTITALDLLPNLKPDLSPDATTVDGSSPRSNITIYDILNKCRTISGQRLLALWLQNPLMSREKITLRQDIVKFFVDNTELKLTCYDDYLRRIPDVLRLAFKISKEKCGISDLVKVYIAIQSAHSLYKTYQQIAKISDLEQPEAIEKLLNCIKSTCDELTDFMQLIENSIDLDEVDETGEYMVKPGSDENLARLTLDLNDFSSRARKQLSAVADHLDLEEGKTLKLETDPEKGFILKVTKNNEQAVRGKNEYEQVGIVKNDGYRFTSRALSKLSTKYLDAKQEYNTAAKVVIEDIVNKAIMYEGEIVEFSITITLIDVFVALAVAAGQNNYVTPLLLDSNAGKICLDKMRHPCVENQPDIENYIPNDVIMSKDGKKFYVITGPNMGGKSTFIKSISICVIMAQCGSMIPAENATISIVDNVLTRIGAGDKQSRGFSTFMSEMSDMSVILKKATENTLVVIDELGRGTSTYDGFGLAWSVSNQLATSIKCYTLFATHFHELTELEEEVDIVGNLHVKAVCQDNKLTMLFDIGQGVCGESYGINVAQFTGFPEHVVDKAKERLKQFEEVDGWDDRKELREFVKECIVESKENPQIPPA